MDDKENPFQKDNIRIAAFEIYMYISNIYIYFTYIFTYIFQMQLFIYEWNSAICRGMDRSRDYHTEWSKSEREKQISYNIAYMWNLEKQCRWTYLQSRNGDTDVREQTYGRKGGWDDLRDWDWHIYTAEDKIDN